MSKYLVIIEAPKKAAKIKSVLGSDYDVYATKGHFRDLPEDGLNVDIDNNFEPTYKIDVEKKELIADLIAKAKKSEIVYLMTDPDREGEAIAWHFAEVLPKGVKYRRVSTQSITKDAIKKAIQEARDLDHNLIKAQKARRILDRVAGYKTSFLVKRGAGGSSAGRVQSAVLHMLAIREKEIISFVPEEYWPISVELLTSKKEKIEASIKDPDQKDIKNGKQAQEIVNALKKGPATVSKFDKKDVASRAQAPFTTSSMYQAASVFGWKSDKTASVAQKLYEAGVITYHRTDATFLVPEFINSARGLIERDYEEAYLPSKPNYYGSAKGAQEAHEACRVTDLAAKEYTGGGTDEAKLYQMIWKRSLACQMTDMKKLAISAEFKIDKYTVSASGSKLKFDGWRRVWDYGSITDTELPEMKVGDKLDVIDVQTEQKFTEPPPRYNERSLIAKMEKDGIGRPSTYASIPKTLEARRYIENGKNITVTALGLKVIDFMVQVGFCFVEIDFTAEMEQKLDDVAQGKKNELDVLNEFWTRLKADIKKSADFKKEKNLSEFDCPDCKAKGNEAKLCLRESRFGKFFSCENYSTKDAGCKYKADVGEDGKPREKVKKEVKTSDKACPECGTMMVVRTGKSGKDFLGCPKFPKCKSGLFDMEGVKIEFAAKKGGWKGKGKWGKGKKSKFSEQDME
jgi:DNA topoisomerase-1